MAKHNRLTVKLSNGQRTWLMNLWFASYEHEEYYEDVWAQLQKGVDIKDTGREEIDTLRTFCEGVVDRVQHGHKDALAYRDRGFGIRILKKIEKATPKIDETRPCPFCDEPARRLECETQEDDDYGRYHICPSCGKRMALSVEIYPGSDWRWGKPYNYPDG